MVSLEFLGKIYDLEVTRSVYQNGRTYLGLYEPSSGEPFASISENRIEISDDDIYHRLEGYEAIVIDNDFIGCFNSVLDCKIWLRDNLKICITTGDIEGLPVLYIKN